MAFEKIELLGGRRSSGPVLSIYQSGKMASLTVEACDLLKIKGTMYLDFYVDRVNSRLGIKVESKPTCAGSRSVVRKDGKSAQFNCSGLYSVLGIENDVKIKVLIPGADREKMHTLDLSQWMGKPGRREV